MPRSNSSIILSISGGSGSGKSTLAKTIRENYSHGEVVVLSCDNYYREQSSLPLESRALANYDHPKAIEFELLAMHLSELSAGRSFRMPVYDFALHNRTEIEIEIHPAPVVIIEGILCLWSENLRPYFDLSIFVDATEEKRLQRRVERDTRERGRTRESVLKQWRESVQPSFLEFCAPFKEHANLVVTTDVPSNQDVETIMKRIEKIQK